MTSNPIVERLQSAAVRRTPEQAEAARRVAEHLWNTVRRAMAEQNGRALIYRLLDLAGWTRLSFAPQANSTVAAHRDGGLEVTRELFNLARSCPEWEQMHEENERTFAQ